MRVINVLVSAAATAAEIRARRFDSTRRTLAKVYHLRLRELFLLAGDFRGHELAVDCQGNENGLALFARDTFAAKGDIFDLQIDNAQARMWHVAAPKAFGVPLFSAVADRRCG